MANSQDDFIIYTPNQGFTGNDSFTYDIDDGNGGTDTAQVSITVTLTTNNQPVAVNDTATLQEDSSVTINVLANDTDADGDTVTLSALAPGANGTTAIVDNQVVYTPNANFNGTDSFNYTITDGNGGVDTGTVSLTIQSINDLPSALNDSVTTLEEQAISIDVLANDNDSDGDDLTISSINAPNNGTAELVNNQILYTPNQGFIGNDSFTYDIDDGNGGTDTAQVSITVAEPGARVTDGLLSLYTFDAGSGDTVFDVSGVGNPLNLQIDSLTGVTWGAGTLDITNANLLSSNQPASKLINGITNTQEFTIETWLTPDNSSQSGPARIATLSTDARNRNFTVGQQGNDYNLRLRTTTNGDNGANQTVASSGALATTDLTHVVYSREADGDISLFINNQLVASESIAGTLTNWDADYQFALGNELNGDRPWLGNLDLVAVYNQAFDSDEVAQNFLAGPDSIANI